MASIYVNLVFISATKTLVGGDWNGAIVGAIKRGSPGCNVVRQRVVCVSLCLWITSSNIASTLSYFFFSFSWKTVQRLEFLLNFRFILIMKDLTKERVIINGVWNKWFKKSRWRGTRCPTLIPDITFFNKALSLESNRSQTNNKH